MGRDSRTAPARAPRASSPESYLFLSRRPLHVLLFILPLVLIYEIGSVIYLTDSARSVIETIRAYSILTQFFEAFGAVGRHLPAITLAVVLVLWHIFEKDKLKVRPVVLLGMTVESVLWTLPLFVLVFLFMTNRPLAAMAVDGAAADPSVSWQAALTLSAGAGVYEELLFRLVLISGIHFLLVDVLRTSSQVGFLVGAVVSAVAFALYHNLTHAGGGSDLRLLGFYSVAGLYFSALFVFRGFGIVVAVHALYDVVVLLSRV